MSLYRGVMASVLVMMLAAPLMAQDVSGEPAQEPSEQQQSGKKQTEKEQTVRVTVGESESSGEPQVVESSTSTVKVWVVGKDGKIIEERIEGEAKAEPAGQGLSYTVENGIMTITLPDGTVRTVSLADKTGAAAAKKLIQLQVQKKEDGQQRDSSEESAILKLEEGGKLKLKWLQEKLPEIDAEISASLEGLDTVLSELGDEETGALKEKIRAAIKASLQDADPTKMMRLGRAAVVIAGDQVSEGDAQMKTFRFEIDDESSAMRPEILERVEAALQKAGVEIDGPVGKAMKLRVGKPASDVHQEILSKLDQLLERMDKLEAEVDALKQRQ